MKQRIHMVGIGGTGMGPLAKVFIEMGCSVSGSDIQTSETTEFLQTIGAEIRYGHAATHVNGASKLVYSSAIAAGNMEVEEAKRRGIPVVHRSEALADLLRKKKAIAVGGAHGKTTLTAMIAWILEQHGLDPTVLIGAHDTSFKLGAKYGFGDYIVAEADESDGSFLRYCPEIAVITNIEADHLENYNGRFEQLVECYGRFLGNCRGDGVCVLGIDSAPVAELARTRPGAVTYGFDSQAQWRAEIEEMGNGTVTFRVMVHEQLMGTVQLKVPGSHNVSNALAAIVVAHLVGVPFANIASALAQFTGAKRRFEVLGCWQDILFVDDYAHHPTEIMATLKAAKTGWNRRIFAVFQPHRYARTKYLMDEFARAFDDADTVVLTDIYAPPPEVPVPNVSSSVLAKKLVANGCKDVLLVPALNDIAATIRPKLRPGDMVITMGAGPIGQAGRQLVSLLKDG